MLAFVRILLILNIFCESSRAMRTQTGTRASSAL
jgi:hypothetical protein